MGYRHVVLLLGCLCNIISYTDRSSLSLTLLEMEKTLHWFGEAEQGVALSAFFFFGGGGGFGAPKPWPLVSAQTTCSGDTCVRSSGRGVACSAEAVASAERNAVLSDRDGIVPRGHARDRRFDFGLAARRRGRNRLARIARIAQIRTIQQQDMDRAHGSHTYFPPASHTNKITQTQWYKTNPSQLKIFHRSSLLLREQKKRKK